MAKALTSGTEEVRLDFSNALSIPFDGNARLIRQEIDEAVHRATDRVLTARDAEHYDFAMAMAIANGRDVPIKVTVIPPHREVIPTSMSIEEASKMVQGYSKCAKLYATFRDADSKARYATLDAVLRHAITEMFPKAKDGSVTAIIEHARMTNGSYVGIVNACETECRLIARLVADATGTEPNIPDKPSTRRPSTQHYDPNAVGNANETQSAREPRRARRTRRKKANEAKQSTVPQEIGTDGTNGVSFDGQASNANA